MSLAPAPSRAGWGSGPGRVPSPTSLRGPLGRAERVSGLPREGAAELKIAAKQGGQEGSSEDAAPSPSTSAGPRRLLLGSLPRQPRESARSGTQTPARWAPYPPHFYFRLPSFLERREAGWDRTSPNPPLLQHPFPPRAPQHVPFPRVWVEDSLAATTEELKGVQVCGWAGGAHPRPRGADWQTWWGGSREVCAPNPPSGPTGTPSAFRHYTDTRPLRAAAARAGWRGQTGGWGPFSHPEVAYGVSGV